MDVLEENNTKYLLNLGMVKSLLSTTLNAELIKENILTLVQHAYSLLFWDKIFLSQKNHMVASSTGVWEEGAAGTESSIQNFLNCKRIDF